MNNVIRAARIDREPLLLGALPRPPSAMASALETPAALTGTNARAEPALVAPAASAAPSEAVRAAEQDRVLRESIAAERQRVLERAREQGHQAGLEQGRAEYEAQLQMLRQLVGSMRAALADAIAGNEDVMVEIAFEAIGKLLGEAMVRREGVQAAVREVMRGVHERERLVVRVSPRDHALLAVDGFKPRNGDGQAVELLADERVELGGCLIETGGGTLDGRLETQLKRLRDTLVGAARASVVEGAS
jgi:flagellar assembly protein FliH